MRMGQITAENYQAYSQLFQNGGKTKAAGKSGAGLADLSALVGASLTGKVRGADTVSLSQNWASGGVINSGKVPAKAITSAADPFYYRNRFNPAVFTKQGGGAALSYFQSNPAQTQDWELQKIQKPDWSQILLPPKQPVMSEDEYVAAIKEQARKDFAAGACANTESFSNLWQTYVSEVSPDRQAIYAESMQKTGGYMNLGAAFFADDGQMVMMYSRDEQMGKNQNMNVMTEEEWARSRKFYDLYRGEMAAQSQNSASSQSGARLDINVAIKESINVTA